MKKIKLSFLCLILLNASLAYAQIPAKADDCIGKYWSPDKDAHIDIYKKADQYFGKITWAKDPKKDIHNPNPALRNKDIVGSEFLIAFKFDGKDTWEKGFIYDARKGNTYKCKMWLDKDRNLSVRGFLGFSLLGQTATFWKRN